MFHLAGLAHRTRPRPATAYEWVNVEGTRVTTESAAATGVSRFVFFSSIAVYGATGVEGADEATTPAPGTPYARSKLRAEEEVRSVAGGAFEACVLRLAAVYGPHVKGNYARLARALASRRFLPLGPGNNRRTLVHEADVAEAALLAARSPQAAGRVYNVSDGQTPRLRDIIEAMCRALGRRPPRLRVPLGLARTLAGIGDIGLSLIADGPRLSPMIEKYTEDVAVRAERIVNDLGFRPRFDLESGWRDALVNAARAKAPYRR